MKKKVKVILTVEIEETLSASPVISGVLEDGSIISFSKEAIIRSANTEAKEDTASNPRVSC